MTDSTLEDFVSSSTEVEDHWKKAGYFPLSLLPRELKLHIMKFMSTADRMRARVCRELYQIESEGKFETEEDLTIGPPDQDNNPEDVNLVIDEGNRENVRATLMKLRNSMFEDIEFFCGMADHSCIPFVKAIRADSLLFIADVDRNERWPDEYLDERSFDSWIEGRMRLLICSYGFAASFTGEQFFHLFTEMSTGRSQMTQFMLTDAGVPAVRRLLELVGIHYVQSTDYHNRFGPEYRPDGRFHTTRRDVDMVVKRGSRPLNGDWGDETALFDNDDLIIYILIGRMKVTVRKGAATENGFDFNDKINSNELSFECYNEELSEIIGYPFTPKYKNSPSDLKRKRRKYKKLPLIFSE